MPVHGVAQRLHGLTLYLGRMMSRNMDRRATGLRNGRVTPTQDRIRLRLFKIYLDVTSNYGISEVVVTVTVVEIFLRRRSTRLNAYRRQLIEVRRVTR